MDLLCLFLDTPQRTRSKTHAEVPRMCCALVCIFQVLERTATARRAAYLADVRGQQDAEHAAALAAIEAEEAAQASATDVVAETFRKFDTDGGGTISRKELRAAMSSLGVELSKRGMKQLMKRFDEDDR